ncbi:hypothetical protein [Metabacillus sp. 84]|uniref:hypothetical protein n=1 Tax=unclassified Metabacillus TaxID=2675274 RepID=UPI003CEA9794
MTVKKTDYQCCAACVHFQPVKMTGGGMNYFCSRLGYETKPHYSFACWEPKPSVINLMKKRGES